MVYETKHEISIVNESIVEYAKVVTNNPQYNITVPNLQYNFFQNKLLVIQFIQNGLPYPLFEKIKAITPFSDETWAEYLNISVKTLQRNKKEKEFLFKPIHSEKIIEIAEVALFGQSIFDSAKKFYSWLLANSYGLGNHIPAELLKNSYGKEMVLSELNRIDQGIFV